MSDPVSILRTQLSAFFPLDELVVDAFVARWKMVSFKRKQLLTSPGDTEKYLYLVLEGVQRAFYLHNDKDVTLVFSYPYSFSGVVDSFLLQQPSIYYLETLTESSFLRIAYHDFEQLIAAHRQLETWLRIAITHVLAGTLQRQVEVMAFTAEEKFTALLRRSPHVLQLIPQKYLASYIGIDPTNFSKLLASVKL